jgi:hypothetical protein
MTNHPQITQSTLAILALSQAGMRLAPAYDHDLPQEKVLSRWLEWSVHHLLDFQWEHKILR